MFSNERGLNKPKNKPPRLCSAMREDWTNQRTNLADFVQWEDWTHKSQKGCMLSNNYLTTLPFPHPLCTDRRDQSTALGVDLLTGTSQMTLLPRTVKLPNNWAEDIVSPPIFVHTLIMLIHAHHNDTSWPRAIITPARQILIPYDQVKTWPFLAKWARQVVEIVLCGGPRLFGWCNGRRTAVAWHWYTTPWQAPEARLPHPTHVYGECKYPAIDPQVMLYLQVQVTLIALLTIAFLRQDMHSNVSLSVRNVWLEPNPLLSL